MQPVVLILLSVCLGVVGQLVLKAGVARLGALSLGHDGAMQVARRIVTNPVIWAGLATYALGTFFWLIALSRVELGYAYPFLSLSYVLVMLTSWILFKEQLSWLRLVGVAVICFGVYAVAGA
jgi:multidrug transporter EmrE-like cation transporter